MNQEYVATFGVKFPPKAITHAIRGDWSYDKIMEARTVCGRRGPFATNHAMNSDPVVTCKSCLRRMKGQS